MENSFDAGQSKSVQARISRYSVFAIADTLFGLEILAVKEVLPLPQFTRIPNVSKFILGVFNLRGMILPLIDIRYFLGLKHNSINATDMILLVEQSNVRLGILVEQVLDIVNVEEERIELPTRNISPLFGNYIGGIYEKEGLGTIYLFDTDKLVNTPELQTYR